MNCMLSSRRSVFLFTIVLMAFAIIGCPPSGSGPNDPSGDRIKVPNLVNMT